MKVAVFSAKPYDRIFLEQANGGRHELKFVERHLDAETAELARGNAAVCVFVNDIVDAAVLEKLALQAIPFVVLRCAGFNNVDMVAATKIGMTIANVPGYSPDAVAEHTLSLVLALNRNLHRAFNRVREGDFALDGLLGFNLRGRTAGVIGTGKIGFLVAQLLRGFGCEVVAFDPWPNEECWALGVEYVSLDELLGASDIVTLHCPLSAENHHLIDAAAIEKMKTGAMLINTCRSGLLDTQAVIDGLRSGKLGYLGLDIYEEESEQFFEDRSSTVLRAEVFTQLLTFPNVMVTGHQGSFTRDALASIAATTIGNISEFEMTGSSVNAIKLD